MVVVNHLKNIQRIIDVIKSDGTVFDGGVTPGLLIDVIFGNPNNDEKLAINEKPVVYVTTKNSIQKTTYPYGTSGNVNSKTVEYEIVLLAESFEDTEFSQKQLYLLMSSLENIFSNNPTFTDPEDIGADPIFTRSIVNQIPWDNTSRGKLVTSVTYILLANIGETSLIDIPGVGDITLLSDTGDEGRNSTVINNDVGNTKISKGNNVGSRFFEYEYSTSTYQTIQSLIDADNELLLILKYPGGDRSYNAKLIFQRDSIRFDGIRTVILQADKVTA